MSKTQRNAVFDAVCVMLGRVPETGEKVTFTRDELKDLHQLVVADFAAGNVDLKDADKRDHEWLVKYVPGLCNNWLRKDLRLNGGTEYVTKNPGSRTGSGDEELKNMKALLSVLTDPETKAKVQAEIDAKLAKIAEAKKPVIDVTKLPEHLRALVPGGLTIRKANS